MPGEEPRVDVSPEEGGGLFVGEPTKEFLEDLLEKDQDEAKKEELRKQIAELDEKQEVPE